MKKTEQEIESLKRKYPNVPEFAIPTTNNKSNSPTNQLTRDIMNHIKFNGGFPMRINSTGTYSEKAGMFIKSGATPFISDIIALYEGRVFFIEVKTGKDKLSLGQQKFKETVQSHGATYWEIKTFPQFISLWNNETKPPFA